LTFRLREAAGELDPLARAASVFGPAAADRSAAASSSAVLPIPGSPTTMTTREYPDRTSAMTRSTMASWLSRHHNTPDDAACG
jgi:hypothetical protein